MQKSKTTEPTTTWLHAEQFMNGEEHGCKLWPEGTDGKTTFWFGYGNTEDKAFDSAMKEALNAYRK